MRERQISSRSLGRAPEMLSDPSADALGRRPRRTACANVQTSTQCARPGIDAPPPGTGSMGKKSKCPSR